MLSNKTQTCNGTDAMAFISYALRLSNLIGFEAIRRKGEVSENLAVCTIKYINVYKS